MRRFKDTNLREFVDLVESFNFKRKITEVHLHHTWRPRQSDYRGQATIQGMWRYHTQELGWSDIAQHVSIGPDGKIWLCRSFNRAPASASGFNGNRHAGPFMIEMIGDFDHGEEKPTSGQMQATLGVIKAIQQRSGLPASALRFHNEMSRKSCPGDSFDKQKLIAEVESTSLPNQRSKAPFPDLMRQGLYELLRSVDEAAPHDEDMSGAELPHGPDGLGGARGAAGPVEQIAALEEYRDHWINLDHGDFSEDGRLTTTKADVDRIFKERLPKEIEKARKRHEPFNLMFYAHGGLVPERVGIQHILAQVPFWRANGVYPIFFVWETGFRRSVRNLLVGAREGARAVARGPILDRVIEEAARQFGGVSIWNVMKDNARRANSQGGGAFYTGGLAKKLVADYPDDLRLHAVGHSAGAIFHAHFLEDLCRNGKCRVETLSLLAPAIRTDLFKEIVAPRMKDDRIGATTIFTMTKEREQKPDPSMGPYGKSLLYLIRGALERDRQAEILGLETSLRDDRSLAALFGLHRGQAKANEIVFSGGDDTATEQAAALGRASDARTHGGFDDDPMTINSILRRILERTNGEPIEPFQPSRADSRGGSAFDDLDYLSEDLADELRSLLAVGGPPSTGQTSAVVKPPSTGNGADPDVGWRPSPGGRRRALCIGINDYRYITPLDGCLNDARRWRDALEGIGYEATMMEQEEATAGGLLERIGAFVSSSRQGDDLVLQFSGHGTQFEDRSGDEIGADGMPDGYDEALCAIDCGSDSDSVDGLVLDDQLRETMRNLAQGASLTCFFDCCHSGTATRMRQARQLQARANGTGPRVRCIQPTRQMIAAYRRISSRSRSSREPLSPMREVLFSACTPDQLAYERDKQGDFTRHALRVLQEGRNYTNTGFINAVIRQFGANALQTPFLDCSPEAREATMVVRATTSQIHPMSWKPDERAGPGTSRRH